MPIKSIDLQHAPGSLVQVCANCGAEHAIALNRGAVETKPGPFKLSEGDTLELAVDGKPEVIVTFAKNDAKDLTATTVAELAKKLDGAGGASARSASSGAVIIESGTTGSGSRVSISGGTARAAVVPEDPWEPCAGRPVLGLPGQGRFENKDLIFLRRCGCGAFEMVSRTWDLASPALAGSNFYEHRRAVNALGEHFKAQGWVHPDLAAKYQAEATPPDCHPAATKQITVPTVGPDGAKVIGKPA